MTEAAAVAGLWLRRWMSASTPPGSAGDQDQDPPAEPVARQGREVPAAPAWG